MAPDGTKRGYRGDINPAVLLRDQLHLSIHLSLRLGGWICVRLSLSLVFSWWRDRHLWTPGSREERPLTGMRWDCGKTFICHVGIYNNSVGFYIRKTAIFQRVIIFQPIIKYIRGIRILLSYNLFQRLFFLHLHLSLSLITFFRSCLPTFPPVFYLYKGKVIVCFRVIGCHCLRSASRGSLYSSYSAFCPNYHESCGFLGLSARKPPGSSLMC